MWGLLTLFRKIIPPFLIMKIAMVGKRADVAFSGKRADVGISGKRAKISFSKVE